MYELNNEGSEPIYVQIADQTLNMVFSGRLRDGDKMPSVRELAANLGINPATVSKAYRLLEERGFIKTEKGLGTFISYSEDSLKLQRDELIQNMRRDIESAKRLNIEREYVIKLIEEIYSEGE